MVVCVPSVELDGVAVEDGVVVVDAPDEPDEPDEVDDDPDPEPVPLVDGVEDPVLPLELVDDELP